jgi:hypothetical protein
MTSLVSVQYYTFGCVSFLARFTRFVLRPDGIMYTSPVYHGSHCLFEM